MAAPLDVNPAQPPSEAELAALRALESAMPAQAPTADPAALTQCLDNLQLDLVAAVHAAIDQFGEDMRANVSPLIPTQAHNMLQGLKETLRAALVALF